jgi:hypothetical protein
MSKHTPGPWVVHANLSGNESHRGYRVAPIEKHNRSWLLAQVMPLDSNGIAGGANARLIAAAPELLESLKSLLWYVGQLEMLFYRDDDAGEHEEVAKARATIKKAEGV